ncbi:MAG: hypothetical protein ACREJD_14140 [Phycisphaerales bacterium]
MHALPIDEKVIAELPRSNGQLFLNSKHAKSNITQRAAIATDRSLGY